MHSILRILSLNTERFAFTIAIGIISGKANQEIAATH